MWPSWIKADSKLCPSAVENSKSHSGGTPSAAVGNACAAADDDEDDEDDGASEGVAGGDESRENILRKRSPRPCRVSKKAESTKHNKSIEV